VFLSPLGALTRGRRNIAECSANKNIRVPFLSRHGEGLERDRQDVGANLLHERLGANADIEAEESGAV